MRTVVFARLLLFLALALTYFSGSPVFTADAQPVTCMRELLSLQDRALWSGEVRDALPGKREQCAASFRGLAAGDWTDKSVQRSAALFMLSGGGVSSLRSPAFNTFIRSTKDVLLLGAIAFASNRFDAAAKHLLELNATAVDGPLRAYLAFAQGTLTKATEPAKAADFLASAQLWLPGGAVEEKALRHALWIELQHGTSTRAVALVERYFRRFGQSLQANSFASELAAAVVRASFDMAAAILGQLLPEKVPQGNAPEVQPNIVQIPIRVAELALSLGKVPLVAEASRMAILRTSSDSPERQIASLYHGIADTLGRDVDGGIKELRAIKRDKITAEHVVLLDTALFVASRLQAPVHDQSPSGKQPSLSSSRQFSESASARDAAQAIVSTDALVSRLADEH